MRAQSNLSWQFCILIKKLSCSVTFYWSRHVSVASSLKGGEFIAPPTVPYIAGHCSFGVEPFLPLSVDLLLLLADLGYFWTSLTLRNIKGIDFRGRGPPTDTASRFLLIQCYCYWAPATKHRGVTFANFEWGTSPSSPRSPSVTFPISNLQSRVVRQSTISNLQWWDNH